MPRKSRGDIVKIKDLFDVYKKRFKAPQSSVINDFIEVVEDITHIIIDKKHITYSVGSRIITIHGPGTLKSEILFKKDEILLHLKGRIGEESTPKDII